MSRAIARDRRDVAEAARKNEAFAKANVDNAEENVATARRLRDLEQTMTKGSR
jgi:hypothetical protein